MKITTAPRLTAAHGKAMARSACIVAGRGSTDNKICARPVAVGAILRTRAMKPIVSAWRGRSLKKEAHENCYTPKTTDYQFFFVDSGVIDAHDMSHLACQFAARVPQCGAEHNYSYASATATLNSPTLCPNEVRKHIPARLLDRAATQFTPPCIQHLVPAKIPNEISNSGCRHENN